MQVLEPSSEQQSSRIALALVVSAVLTAGSLAASSIHGYLPAHMSYDESIPAPHRILGYEVGSRQVTPEEQMAYIRHLAALSPRVELETQGRTHEGRPQLLAVISSPENLERLEEIRKTHLDRALNGGEVGDSPVVVWLAYSIHGNESSGANASLAIAYHLAAGQGGEMERLLQNAVILLDPCQNPDGLARFSQWVNSHRGRVPVADPRHRERVEPWPGARGNHYWFDLNRDWLLLQHPESRARVKTFHRWKPNLVTDFHEMWSSGTYFFQPGVPSRQGIFTPPRNLELTREIARHHARALDEAGRLYFSEEVFDDFYYGKGSSYPDISGSVGVLFEQASARGQRQKTKQGILEFPFTIHNQVITSLSSLEAALEKREELLAYQAWFFAQARREAAGDPVKGYLCDGSPDPARRHAFLEVLLGHGIEARELENDGAQEKTTSAGALVVPTDQDQYRLVKALFTTASRFEDTTFYDISSWTLPLAFGLNCRELHRQDREIATLGAPLSPTGLPEGHFTDSDDAYAYAYAFEWRHHFAPRALSRLLMADIDARVSSEAFEADTGDGPHHFPRGSVIIPLGTQRDRAEEIAGKLELAVQQDALDVFALSSGLTLRGNDLGSPSTPPVKAPRPFLLVGRGISGSEAGEVWHLLDHRFGLELPLIDKAELGRLPLTEYTHMLMVSGSYDDISDDVMARVRNWVAEGGTVVATKGSVQWAGGLLKSGDQADTNEESVSESDSDTDAEADAERSGNESRRAYGEYDDERAAQRIAGAIFQVGLDLTHPLGYGYAAETLSVFRNGTLVLPLAENPYENVAVYSESPLVSGYTSAENVSRISGSAAITATRLGKGAVVLFVDNPNFRAFWYGTEKLYLNALFFSQLIRETSAPGSWVEMEK